MKKSLGVYFGPKVISLVETSGKTISNKFQIQRSVLYSAELEEKVPDDVKVTTLLKDELAKNQIDCREAFISLSGKDLIIRTFEVPVLPASEMLNVVNFEVKKYIPFKTEELVSDYQIELDRSIRRNQVLYVGIKKETLDRYVSIFSQLNIKTIAVEYSGFSALRFLKLTNFSDRGIVGVVTMDFVEDDEINFTIMEKGFPLFSRDITMYGAAEQAAGIEPVSTFEIAIEKLKTEIRVSLDYFHRKFPAKNITKIYYVGNKDYCVDLDAFFKDMTIPSQFIDAAKYMGKQQAFSLGLLKGLGASLFKTVNSRFKMNVVEAKAKVAIQKEKTAQVEQGSFLSGIELDFRVIFLGLVICIGTFAFGIYRLFPVQNDLKHTLSLRVEIPGVDVNSTPDDLKSISQKTQEKIKALNDLIVRQLYLTETLDSIPRIIPEDIRLTNFSFMKKDNKGYLTLQGTVYMGDSTEEFNLINKFASQLKTKLKKDFKEVAVSDISHQQIDKVKVTSFTINCRS